jgi:hypothetical protein
VPPLKLIFAHPPKSGGTSIRAAVTEFFSHDLMLADYGDRLNDPISPMNIDPCGFLSRYRRQNAAILANKAAVVGHFWIAKYEGVAPDVRATILGPDHSRYLSILLLLACTKFTSAGSPTIPGLRSAAIALYAVVQVGVAVDC